jgi:hypothetical protein
VESLLIIAWGSPQFQRLPRQHEYSLGYFLCQVLFFIIRSIFAVYSYFIRLLLQPLESLSLKQEETQMKNPKQFSGATPFSHFKPVDKSATGSGDLKHNDTRPWAGATPYSHSKPTKHSGHEGMGNPMGVEKAEVMTAHNHFKPTPHSKPEAPRAAKKWHKSGKYDMSLPTTMSK